MTTASYTTEEVRMDQQTIDILVGKLTDLNFAIEALEGQVKAVRLQLAEGLEHGAYSTTSGVEFTVRGPNRTFNLTRAYESLPDDVKPSVCGPVAALVKARIPQAEIDRFMDPGKGSSVVVLR